MVADHQNVEGFNTGGVDRWQDIQDQCVDCVEGKV